MTAEDYAEQVRAELGEAWLPNIYRERVRAKRTRSYHFAGLTRKAQVQVQHTLLGVELKVGRTRLLCPDLATARYLSVFARAGCADVAVPYDITKISQLADEFESSWHRMLLLAEHKADAMSENFRRRLAGILVNKIKDEVAAIGAGTSMPQFKQSTRQRG